MIDHKNIQLIAFVGLSGVGKSVATKYLTEKGLPKVSFDQVLSDIMAKNNLEINGETLREFRQEQYQNDQMSSVTSQIIEQITHLINAGQHKIIIDGLFSWGEYKAIKHTFPGELVTVALVSTKNNRHKRLVNNVGENITMQEADKWDWDEIETLEKGGPIAIADYFIDNDNDLDHLYQKIDQLANNLNLF